MKNPEVFKNRNLESIANYKGDWTLLLQERLQNETIEAQYLARQKDLINDIQEEISSIEKSITSAHTDSETLKWFENFKLAASKHIELIRADMQSYNERDKNVFSRTDIDEPDNQSFDTAQGWFGEPGVVLLGYHTRRGLELNDRMKNIIESHEKGHGVRMYGTGYLTDLKVQNALDLSKIEKSHYQEYFSDSNEIIERMSQLKNYFGFKGSERFTKQHLDYAREHYLIDIGYDNAMSDFFNAITPETEHVFIEVINSYGV